MNKINLDKKQLKTWYTSYNPYTDILQIYSNKAFKLAKNDIEEKIYDNLVIKFEKITGNPILFEFQNTYATLNLDPEEVSQDRLIEVISGIIKPYE